MARTTTLGICETSTFAAGMHERVAKFFPAGVQVAADAEDDPIEARRVGEDGLASHPVLPYKDTFLSCQQRSSRDFLSWTPRETANIHVTDTEYNCPSGLGAVNGSC